MNHKEENELLVDGFVRDIMTKYKMNIPFAIMKFIGIWHVCEYAHIMNEFGYIQHKQINIDRILDFE